jgi:hypothetical protein
MAIVHTATTVGTTATIIAEIPAGNPLTAVLVFNDDQHPIFVGDATTTTSGADTGLKLAKSTTSSQIWLNAGDKLYAVSAAGTASNAVVTLFSKVVA